MATIRIEVSETTEEFLMAKAAERGYPTAADYVRDLVLRHQERAIVEQHLVAAVESGDFEEVTPAFWARLRAPVREMRRDAVRGVKRAFNAGQ